MVDVVLKSIGRDRMRGRVDVVSHKTLFHLRMSQEAWEELDKNHVIYAYGIDDPRDPETPGWSTFGKLPLGGLELVFA